MNFHDENSEIVGRLSLSNAGDPGEYKKIIMN